MSLQVLVWGASPTDANPLFLGTECSGPPAGAFRAAVRDRLRLRCKEERIEFYFSEDGNRHGHHEQNPGFYEPRQLADSTMVILLLPGNRPMAVNTWELALACETEADGTPRHLNKLVFVVPHTLYHYLSVAMAGGALDPAEFIWPNATEEPILGAQNSFAARWIYLIAPKRFAAVKETGNPTHVLPITYYDDSISWDMESEQTKKELGKIANFIQSLLPV